MEIKLSFGLRDGKIVHISEIKDSEHGLKCSCFCPCCNSPLQARMGEVRKRYFAHSNVNCEYARETALHIFAKEILEKHKKIKLPEVIAKYKNLSEVVCAEKLIPFDTVILEKRIGDVIPDVILGNNGNELIVEIKVTHKVDEDKLKKIIKLQISTLEIDLSDVDIEEGQFVKKLVEEIIINGIDYKDWLFNKKIHERQEELKIRYEQNITAEAEEDKRKKLKQQQEYQRKLPRIKKIIEGNQELIQIDQDLKKNPAWIECNRFLKLDGDNIPTYLNKKIKDEIVFDCDRRIWQVKLFSSFIYRQISRGKSKWLGIKYIVSWLKKKPYPLPINWDLVYLRNVKEYSDYPDLDNVVGEFFLNLCNYGFLRVSETTFIGEDNQYDWWFERLEEGIKVLPQKYRETNFIEVGSKLIDKETGELVGELADVYQEAAR